MKIYVWDANAGENWRHRPPDETFEPEGGEADALYQELLSDPGVDHVEAEL
jgi:hypothetical protein